MCTRRLLSGCLVAVCLVLTVLGVLIVRDDRTTFFAETLYVFALTFGLFGFYVLLPIGWIGWERRRSTWQAATSVLTLYALTAIFLGWFAYMLVPAVYTRDQRWSAPPHSNSLGAIHGDLLYRASIPEAIDPERAPAIRAMVREERRVFFSAWLRLSLAGLILPASLLLARTYRERRIHRR